MSDKDSCLHYISILNNNRNLAIPLTLPEHIQVLLQYSSKGFQQTQYLASVAKKGDTAAGGLLQVAEAHNVAECPRS